MPRRRTTRSAPRHRRLTASLAVGSLVLAGFLAGGGTASASAKSATAARSSMAACDGNLCAQAGDLVDVALGELHPTQATLGFDQIYYKLDRYKLDKDEDNGDPNKRFDDWCETNGQDSADHTDSSSTLADPSSFTCKVKIGDETSDDLAEMKSVVVGPGGTLYLVDGHHSLTAFDETPDGGPDMHIRVRVLANYSGLTTDAFWQAMEAQNWVWLQDANGDAITPAQLPSHLGLANFQDDPYRSLVYFTRDIGYQVPDDADEYLEFLWGSWLRTKVDLADYDLDDLGDYLDAVEDASKDMTSVDEDTVIANGETAEDLGQMDDWNDGKKASGGEFGDLSKKITSDKPGKIAYALDYRDQL